MTCTRAPSPTQPRRIRAGTLSEPTRRRRRALGVEKRPGAGNNLAAAAGWFRAAHPLESHA
jgi:hypothetical protein